MQFPKTQKKTKNIHVNAILPPNKRRNPFINQGQLKKKERIWLVRYCENRNNEYMDAILLIQRDFCNNNKSDINLKR